MLDGCAPIPPYPPGYEPPGPLYQFFALLLGVLLLLECLTSLLPEPLALRNFPRGVRARVAV